LIVNNCFFEVSKLETEMNFTNIISRLRKFPSRYNQLFRFSVQVLLT
jgi:hypothetical protein